MHANVEDVVLHAEVRGEDNAGTPVVFLHGIGGHSGNWAPQMEVLSGRYTVIALDSRGFGKSLMRGQDLSLEDYADDVRRALDELGVSTAHLVGLSMGGMVAQTLALAAPERVASLVLADTSGHADEQMAANLKVSGAAAMEHGMGAVADLFMPATFCAAAIEEDPAYVREFRSAFCATDPHAFNTGLHAIAGLDVLDRLDLIDVPVLVVVGSDDALTPMAHSEAITRAIDGARLEVIHGAGHLSNLDGADEFTRLLTDFLEGR